MSSQETSVLYACPCLRPSAPEHSFHALSSLYFCETCDRILCRRCVCEEIMLYFCPNCMFEVPNASVRAEKNRCARNCFECPICVNTLSVVQGKDDSEWGLQCNVCRWDSWHWMTWDKPTGLGAKVHKYEDMSPDHLEFNNLKTAWAAHLKSLNDQAEIENYKPSTSSAPGSLSRHRHKSRKMPQGSSFSKDNQGFKFDFLPSSLPFIQSEEAKYTAITNASCLEEIQSLAQRCKSAFKTDCKTDNLVPERIRLATKLLKRCSQCRSVVIKPDSKASSAKFKIRTMARTYLPQITFKRSSQSGKTQADIAWRAGRSYLPRVDVVNPLFDVITVSFDFVSCSQEGVTIVLPDFETEIGAFSDEYGSMLEDQDSLMSAQSGSTELVRNTRNQATFKFLVQIPKDFVGGHISFDLNVTYTYRNLLGPEDGADDSLTGEIKPFTFLIRLDCGHASASNTEITEDGSIRLKQKIGNQ